MLEPLLVAKDSAYVGVECALCKQPFNPGDPIVICPVDETPHHTYCWQSNRNRCAALACAGRGELAGAESETRSAIAPPLPDPLPAPPPRPSRPRRPNTAPPPAERPAADQQPGRSLRFAQSCLILSIAIAIIVMAFSCFGLWLLLDYFFIDVLGWSYRAAPGLWLVWW